jgi:hypothetical protein
VGAQFQLLSRNNCGTDFKVKMWIFHESAAWFTQTCCCIKMCQPISQESKWKAIQDQGHKVGTMTTWGRLQ